MTILNLVNTYYCYYSYKIMTAMMLPSAMNIEYSKTSDEQHLCCRAKSVVRERLLLVGGSLYG